MQRVEEEEWCLFNRERGGGGGEVYYITNGIWRGKDNLLSRHGGAVQPWMSGEDPRRSKQPNRGAATSASGAEGD